MITVGFTKWEKMLLVVLLAVIAACSSVEPEVKRPIKKPSLAEIRTISNEEKWIHGQIVGKIHTQSKTPGWGDRYFIKIKANNGKSYRLQLMAPHLGLEPIRTPSFLYEERFKIAEKVKFIGYKLMQDCSFSKLNKHLDPNSPYEPPYDYHIFVNIGRFPEGIGKIAGDEIYIM